MPEPFEGRWDTAFGEMLLGGPSICLPRQEEPPNPNTSSHQKRPLDHLAPGKSAFAADRPVPPSPILQHGVSSAVERETGATNQQHSATRSRLAMPLQRATRENCRKHKFERLRDMKEDNLWGREVALRQHQNSEEQFYQGRWSYRAAALPGGPRKPDAHKRLRGAPQGSSQANAHREIRQSLGRSEE